MIESPKFSGLVVTRDEFGSGTSDAGIEYATFRIARPDTSRRYGTRLASVTVYADGLALVDDELNGHSVADMNAVNRLRDMLTDQFPNAIHSGYRYL